MEKVVANKRLGQHFLDDEAIISQIVACIEPKAQQNLLEIGPGLGALTLPVLAKCGRLTAIELDRRVLNPLMQAAKAYGELELIHADILQVDLSALAQNGALRLIGNLPYNLSTPILFHCLAHKAQIEDMHFMLQKEVVERIVAAPNQKNYGRLSLMMQLWCEAESLLDIPPSAFNPPPKVDSAIVRLIPAQAPRFPVENIAAFELLVRVAFSQRRKMIRNTLGAYFTQEEFIRAGIAPTARPETLTGEQYAILANQMEKIDE